MTDPKRRTHEILLEMVRAGLREAGLDVRNRTRDSGMPRAVNLVVMENSDFPDGFSVVIRTQNVSGSTERKAKDLVDELNRGDLGTRPVVFVVDGHHSDGMRQTLQAASLSKCLGVFTVRDLLLWLHKSGKQKPRQAMMF